MEKNEYFKPTIKLLEQYPVKVQLEVIEVLKTLYSGKDLSKLIISNKVIKNIATNAERVLQN